MLLTLLSPQAGIVGVVGNLSKTLDSVVLISTATVPLVGIEGNLSSILSNITLNSYAISGILDGGGISKRKGWGREREILEESLRRIEAQDMRDIAETMAKSERPQAKRIIRKLADYSGEIRQLESLQRELAKLEAIQRERKVTDAIQAEKEKELTLAAAELKSILQEESEIIEAYLQLEQYETRVLLSAIGITVH